MSRHNNNARSRKKSGITLPPTGSAPSLADPSTQVSTGTWIPDTDELRELLDDLRSVIIEGTKLLQDLRIEQRKAGKVTGDLKRVQTKKEASHEEGTLGCSCNSNTDRMRTDSEHVQPA